MAVAAIRFGRSLRLVRAFASSSFTSPSTVSLVNGSNSSGGAGLSHSFGYSHLHGFEKPCPPWRHLLARCMTWNWTELKDCKHWLVTFNFPKDPAPTREEMIDTYVKTLAKVLGSEEEAKKKIYGLSTTTYTGFQCNVDEATSERMKEEPLVTWVLPDGCGELGIITGDKYENGVITPDPNPPKPYNERPRNRNYDRMGYERQRDFRPMEGRRNMPSEEGRRNMPSEEGRRNMPSEEGRRNMPSEHRDNRNRDNYNYSSTERRNSMQGDQFDRRPPFEQRNPVQGYQRENMQRADQKDPILPMDRRDSYQGEQSDILYEGQKEAGHRQGQ